MSVPSPSSRLFRWIWIALASVYGLVCLSIAWRIGREAIPEIRVGVLLLAFLAFLGAFFFFFYDIANLSIDRQSVLLHDLRLTKPPLGRLLSWIIGGAVSVSLLVWFVLWRSA